MLSWLPQVIDDHALLSNPACHEYKVHQSRKDLGDNAGAIADENSQKLDKVESLPREVDENAEDLVTESVLFVVDVETPGPVKKEPQCQIDFEWEVEAGESSVANETLEDPLNIVVVHDHTDHVEVGQSDTDVMKHSRSRYLLVEKDLQKVLHCVHCGYIDHDLGILFVPCCVNQIDIFSP